MVVSPGRRNVAPVAADHDGELDFIVELLGDLRIQADVVLVADDRGGRLAEELHELGEARLAAAGAGALDDMLLVVAADAEDVLPQVLERRRQPYLAGYLAGPASDGHLGRVEPGLA